MSTFSVACKTKPNTIAMGAPLGYVAVPDFIAAKAATVANEFWISQTESQFNYQADEIKPTDLALDWVPHEELKALGYKVDDERHHWVMTTGLDPHTDNDFGMTLAWVIVNDEMYFKQGKSRYTHKVGEWFVFNDAVAHGVDLKKQTDNQAVFICWSMPLVPLVSM